jgi:predicted nucleotidyltransferase
MSFDWMTWEGFVGEEAWLRKATIFVTRHGSHAYGTNIEGSDEDFKGICIAPMYYRLGNLHSFEQKDKGFGDSDACIYDVKKFFKLATDCNPNIIEVLHTDESDWIYPDRLVQAVRHGAQLKRIKTHRNWLLHPIEAQPTRKGFGLPDEPTLDRDQLNAIQSEVDKLADKLGGEGFTRDRVEDNDVELVEKVAQNHEVSKNLIETIVKERRFRNAMKQYQQYQAWKSQRNEKRAALEAKYGYDTKHAMHLVRLMRMATEILDGKGVIVKRPDKDDLLGIRAGTWKFDDLMAWAEKMELELHTKYAESKLPHDPPRQKLDDLLIDVIEGFRGVI